MWHRGMLGRRRPCRRYGNAPTRTSAFPAKSLSRSKLVFAGDETVRAESEVFSLRPAHASGLQLRNRVFPSRNVFSMPPWAAAGGCSVASHPDKATTNIAIASNESEADCRIGMVSKVCFCLAQTRIATTQANTNRPVGSAARSKSMSSSSAAPRPNEKKTTSNPSK